MALKFVCQLFQGARTNVDFSIDLMEEFFDFLESNSYRALVSLVEVHEFDQFISYPKFEEKIGKRNFSWFFHPLKDMTAPDEIFTADFFETQSSFVGKFAIWGKNSNSL